MAYRAMTVLDSYGLNAGTLADRYGLDRSTWYRFLKEGRPIKSLDPRAAVEELLDEAGHPITSTLWEAVSTDGETSSISTETQEFFMQGQILSDRARDAYKLFRDPFAPGAILDGAGKRNELYLPPEHRFVLARLQQAMTTCGFVALSSAAGSGKSTLMDEALRIQRTRFNLVTVTPHNIERRKLHANHISSEIIHQLSEERVPRTTDSRDALAKKVLIQRHQAGDKVVLLIDEAHELPDNTIKDLKRYQEMQHGWAPLLGIVMVGQEELRPRLQLERNHQLREVIIRLQLLELPPMATHVAAYMARRFEWVGADLLDTFEEAALERLEAALDVHRQQYPIQIGNAARAAMNLGAKRGSEKVTEDDVESALSMDPTELQDISLR